MRWTFCSCPTEWSSRRPQSFEFLGRIHPYVIVLLVPCVLALRSARLRPWIAATVLGLLGWAAGTLAAVPDPQRFRSLRSRSRRHAATLPEGLEPRHPRGGLILGAYSGLQGHWLTGADPHRLIDRSGDSAIAFCNEVLPDDMRVALLFSWRSADITLSSSSAASKITTPPGTS